MHMLAMSKFIKICSCSSTCQGTQKIIKYINSFPYVIVGIGIKNCMGIDPVQHDKLISYSADLLLEDRDGSG